MGRWAFPHWVADPARYWSRVAASKQDSKSHTFWAKPGQCIGSRAGLLTVNTIEELLVICWCRFSMRPCINSRSVVELLLGVGDF